MRKQKFLFFLMLAAAGANAQKVTFTEYDLKNGLHVVLHQDKTAPVVAVSVMYHVGSKDETTNRTGFAHFFEHLLFEGSDNIKRGEFMKIVSRTMQTLRRTVLFIMKSFPPINWKQACGWKVSG